MNDQAIFNELLEIFREVFSRENMILQPDYAASDVEGWDSIKHIEIILSIEDHFSIKFSTRDLDRLDTVGDLVELIKEKRVDWQKP